MPKTPARPAWKDPNKVGQLIDRLNGATKPNESGSITFVEYDHDELFDLLADYLVVPDGVTSKDILAAAYRAFIELRKDGTVTARPLLSEICRRISLLKALPMKKFTMWTKLRLSQIAHAPELRFKVGNVNIRTSAHLPKWLQLDKYFVSGVGHISPNEPSLFGHLILTTQARNENQASQIIFEANERFQAAVNTSFRSNEFFIQRRPTAVLLDGPYYFFFENSRFLGSKKVWYSQTYDEKLFRDFPKKASEFAEQAKTVRKILKLLEAHPLADPIDRAIRLINDGMTNRDLSFRLMRFWSAAEALYTSPIEKIAGNAMIERMVFAVEEGDLAIERRKLERSYEQRNSFVHQGSNERDDTPLTQNLRETVLIFAYYLLFNAEDIETHQEVLQMIDPKHSPKKVGALVRAIERRRLIEETGRHRLR